MFNLITLPLRILLSPITIPLDIILTPLTVPLRLVTYPLRHPLFTAGVISAYVAFKNKQQVVGG